MGITRLKAPVARSFESREQANQWAYRNGRADQRLFVITENVPTPFTYWVLCEQSFDLARTVQKRGYQILSVYE